jgi:hypothetical protein
MWIRDFDGIWIASAVLLGERNLNLDTLSRREDIPNFF